MRRLVLLFVFAGCAGGRPPIATAADATRANVSLAALEEGRTLLVQKCSGCHKPPMPSEHTRDEWPTALAEMSGRAKIDRAQRKSIETYLLAMLDRPAVETSAQR